MRRLAFSVSLAFVALLACAEKVDWNKAKEISPGVRYREFAVETPRMMKCYMARVDLTQNDLVSSEKGMKRERTLEFAKRLRGGGTNVVVAVNMCPWGGGCGDSPESIANYRLDGLNVQNGEISSDKAVKGWFDGFFGVRKDGTPEVLDVPPETTLGEYRILLNGYARVLKDGVPFNRRKEKSLHPRTAVGVSKDRRYVYLLAVDGRQKGWSLGADYEDEAKFMLEAGAWDAVNMDGGGSTTIVCRDAKAKRLRMMNRHDAMGAYTRAVAISLAVVPKKRGK